jgi:hypothetical protein
MCGRFDTSPLAWRDVHDALSRFLDPAQDARELMAAVRPERFEMREAA